MDEYARLAAGRAGGGMDPNRLTEKMQEAVQAAQSIAIRRSHQQIDVEHLLAALLEQEGGLAGAILTKAGGSAEVLGQRLGHALERYGRDLTEAARQGKLDPVIGRDNETRRVIQVLSRRTKNNPVLIGEPGVGKTAIVEGLAQRIVRGDVPEGLKDKRIVSLDMG